VIRRALALPALLALSACDTLLGLDPGKVTPMGAGGSETTTTSTGGGGSGGGSGCPAEAGSACTDVVWNAVFADAATTHCAGTGLGADAQGNVVMVGYFGPEITFGDTMYAVGAFDYFMVKLDPIGQPLWISQFGSVANDSATFPLQVAVDEGGQIAVAGAANGAIDFGGGPLVAAPEQKDFDVVVARFDEQGHHVWSKRFGSVPRPQVATQVALDTAGDVIVAGWFQGSLDLGGGPLPTLGSGTQNGFVAKLDGATGTHAWSQALDAAQSADVGSLAVDKAGDVLLGGNLDGYLDLGAATLTGYGLYLAQFDGEGSYQWARAITSSGNAYGSGAAFDRLGNALVTGLSGGSIQLGPTGSVTDATGDEGFLVKLDPAGSAIWSMPVPTSRVVADGLANVVVAGSFSGAVDVGGRPLASAGGQDMVLAKLDPMGVPIWAKRFGDAANQYAGPVAVVPGSNRVVLAGWGSGQVDFGRGPLFSAGSADVFVAVFEP
jgi:hypothetical protein